MIPKRPYSGLDTTREPALSDTILKPADWNLKLGGDIVRRDLIIASRAVSLVKGPHSEDGRSGTCSPDCPFLAFPEIYGNCYEIRADCFIESETNLFWPNIDSEIYQLVANYPWVFIRLHYTGDFKSPRYVEHWRALMRAFPRVSIWGTTSWLPPHPIGRAIVTAVEEFGPRWRTLFSNRLSPSRSTHIFRKHELIYSPEGRVNPIQTVRRDDKEYRYFLCPEQVDHYINGIPRGEGATCATCGYCMFAGGERREPPNVGWLFHADWI